jgi:UDP-3-O-[3-hydroxymyristoyl] glucosamine N-acyltransferase
MKLSELAKQLQLQLHGEDADVDNVADLQNAGPASLAFVYNAKYLQYIGQSRAAAIIISPEWLDKCDKPALVSSNPRLDFARAAGLLHPQSMPEPGIHVTAVIHDSVSIPDNVYIGPNVVIEQGASIADHVHIGAGSFLGRNVSIGEYTYIHPNVTIEYDCVVGKHCEIYAGVVIGTDGFGYVRNETGYMKVPQLGCVVIGDNVDIGANTTIDRGALNNTEVHDGVKLDNGVQISHNVVVGKNTIMSGHSGVSGSTRVGENCIIGGGVGIRDNLTVVDNVVITGRSFVSSSLEQPGSYSSSVLIDTTRNWKRNVMRFKHLDELAKKVKMLENALLDKEKDK